MELYAIPTIARAFREMERTEQNEWRAVDDEYTLGYEYKL
jgi:hypothetical protein